MLVVYLGGDPRKLPESKGSELGREDKVANVHMSVIYHWRQQGTEDALEVSPSGVREPGYVYTSSHIPSLPLTQAEQHP